MGGVGLGQEGVALLARDARRVEEAVILHFVKGALFNQKLLHFDSIGFEPEKMLI